MPVRFDSRRCITSASESCPDVQSKILVPTHYNVGGQLFSGGREVERRLRPERQFQAAQTTHFLKNPEIAIQTTLDFHLTKAGFFGDHNLSAHPFQRLEHNVWAYKAVKCHSYPYPLFPVSANASHQIWYRAQRERPTRLVAIATHVP